jgi:hypothetical protein
MSFRIIDTSAALDQAVARLREALSEWAGGGDVWADGESYARREDVYLFVIAEAEKIAIGAALTGRDEEILRIELPRKEPTRDRKRAALVVGDGDAPFLMVSLDELRRQGLRDPLRRLAGASLLKRATVANREYLLVGPLSQAKAADALLSLAALSPAFERHVEKLGALAGEGEEDDLYLISARVAGAHRVRAKIGATLLAKLRTAGFQVADIRNGPIKADFAVARADAAIAFEIRPDAALSDFLAALGRLALVAPGGGAFRRALVLPAPRDNLAAATAPFETACREIGVWVLMFDFKDGAAQIWSQTAPADLPEDVRQLFS